jgi:hypothetical protein
MTQEMIVTLVSICSIGMILPIIAIGYVELTMLIYERNIMKGMDE